MNSIYKIMFFISLALVVGSILAIGLFGLPLGIDFRGGSEMEVRFGREGPDVSELRSALSGIDGIGDPVIFYTQEQSAIIRLNDLSEARHQEVLSAIFGLAPAESDSVFAEELKFESIGPVIGDELKGKSITALILVLAAIIVYIAFVFRRLSRTLSPWVMGLGATAALVHDIIVPVGFFAVLNEYSGVTLSAVFVAALLTILGYSVSDTVVVYDRVRENVLRYGSSESFGQTVHKSVMQTLSRSINTTISTVLALAAIYFFGGQSLKFFSLALIIGIVAGSYSSIFIASPMLVWLSKKK